MMRFSMTENIKALIEEYSLDYCCSLESVYGEGMMSEGGDVELERLFHGIDFNGKSIIDYGCGLGGVSFYIAKQFDCHIFSLDINSQIIDRVNCQQQKLCKSKALRGKISAICHTDMKRLPFNDNSMDMIISKGVLTHVKNKNVLFNAFNKALKKEGTLLINDWLSPLTNHWGPKVKKMIEIEGLSIHALCASDYLVLLKEANFTLCMHDEVTKRYAKYNQSIVDYLKSGHGSRAFVEKNSESLRQEYILSYQSITTAMQTRELQVHTFLHQKK